MKSFMQRLSQLIFLLLFMTILASCGASGKLKRDNIHTVIKTARSYTGTPYQYGGLSRKGMDCSGLVLTSFKSINVSLPRTVVEQSKQGRGVPMDEVKKGDLLIFRIKRKGKKKVWHSGIVTEVTSGKVMFIHASSSRGVVESNLMSDYYRKSFKTARRIL